MEELAKRRKRLFSGAPFSAALFFNAGPGSSGSPSFHYFSGCRVDGSYLVLKRGGGLMLAHEMNYEAAKAVSHYPVKLLGKDAPEAIRAACGKGKVGFSSVEMHAARYMALKKKAKLKLVDAYYRIEAIRGKKTEKEVAAIAAAAKITRKLLDALDPWQCESEEEVARLLKIVALEAGCELSYEPIVASGRNSRFPHHTPGKAKLGSMVLVDFGVKKNSYCSDFTRCYFRKKGTKEMRTYLVCKRIFEKIVAKLPECRTGRDVALLSETLIEQHKLPKPIHSIGHGIGLEVHEYPHLGRKANDRLEGVVLAIEPAAYFKTYGVRFEEMVANTKKGWKRL